MEFDRNQFKAPTLAVNREASSRVDSITRSKRNNNYLTIDEGVNVFRLFPPHDASNPTFQPRAVYWLKCHVQKKDSDGNPIEGEYEWRDRPVLDSRVHGDTIRDIVDEYIKFTRKVIYAENQDKEDVKKKLAPITGWKGKDGKWNRGISINVSYLAYATKGDIRTENFGILEIYAADKAALEALNIDEVSGEVIQTDIFSGPNAPDQENGGCKFCISLLHNPSLGKWERKVTRLSFKPSGKGDVNAEWKRFNESQMIPDEVLEHWYGMPSLAEQYKGIYKRSDFLMAVEALEKFDKDNGFSTFDSPEFMSIVSEFDALYPEAEEKEVPKPAGQPTPRKKHLTYPIGNVPEEGPEAGQEEEEEGPEDGSPDFPSMTREQLKAFIKENSLPITVYKSTSTEALAMKVAEEWENKRNLEAMMEEEEEEEPEAPVPVQKQYNFANAKPGEAPSSVDAGAGKEKDDDLPWSVEEEKPSNPPVSKEGKTLRERLAEIKKNAGK